MKAAVKSAAAVRSSLLPMRCRLLELDLQHNDAREAGSEVLADAVAHMWDLQKFLFAGNWPAYEGMSKLVSALLKCPALQVWPPHTCPHFCLPSCQAKERHRGATECLAPPSVVRCYMIVIEQDLSPQCRSSRSGGMTGMLQLTHVTSTQGAPCTRVS